MKFEKIIGKKIILYTKKNFRFQGEVKDFDGQFIEIFDELKNKPKMININEITEYEIDEPNDNRYNSLYKQ
jgi:hypothetical protein